MVSYNYDVYPLALKIKNITDILSQEVDSKRETRKKRNAGNKGEILPNFFLEIIQYDFTKIGGGNKAWTKSLLETNRAIYNISNVVRQIVSARCPLDTIAQPLLLIILASLHCS